MSIPSYHYCLYVYTRATCSLLLLFSRSPFFAVVSLASFRVNTHTYLHSCDNQPRSEVRRSGSLGTPKRAFPSFPFSLNSSFLPPFFSTNTLNKHKAQRTDYTPTAAERARAAAAPARPQQRHQRDRTNVLASLACLHIASCPLPPALPLSLLLCLALSLEATTAVRSLAQRARTIQPLPFLWSHARLETSGLSRFAHGCSLLVETEGGGGWVYGSFRPALSVVWTCGLKSLGHLSFFVFLFLCLLYLVGLGSRVLRLGLSGVGVWVQGEYVTCCCWIFQSGCTCLIISFLFFSSTTNSRVSGHDYCIHTYSYAALH